MGGNGIHSSGALCWLARCALGAMVVAERVSPLSMPLFHRSGGGRPILLPHAVQGLPIFRLVPGLSNLTGPSLFFLAPGYQPMFYVDKLLLSENHVFFTLMLVLGIPFCWKHPGFRYVVVLLATLFSLHTNFLAALSPAILLLFSAARHRRRSVAPVMLYDRLLSLARRAGDSSVARFRRPCHRGRASRPAFRPEQRINYEGIPAFEHGRHPANNDTD